MWFPVVRRRGVVLGERGIGFRKLCALAAVAVGLAMAVILGALAQRAAACLGADRAVPLEAA